MKDPLTVLLSVERASDTVVDQVHILSRHAQEVYYKQFHTLRHYRHVDLF